MTRPICAITFPDGCVLTYSHPDGDEFPRADLTKTEGHVELADDIAIAHAVGKAFLQALGQTAYEAKPEGVPA